MGQQLGPLSLTGRNGPPSSSFQRLQSALDRAGKTYCAGISSHPIPILPINTIVLSDVASHRLRHRAASPQTRAS
jgi:hypothetical protein